MSRRLKKRIFYMLLLGLNKISLENALRLNFDLIEEKIDGHFFHWNGKDLLSKRKVKRNERFPHLVESLRKIFPEGEIYGEVAIENGTVYDIARSENWNKALFYPFLIERYRFNLVKNRELLESIAKDVNNKNIKLPKKFKNVDEGYKYVKENGGEGLVLKTNDGILFKLKTFKEKKCRILDYNPMNGKGSFEIEFENNVAAVSATSQIYINAYEYLRKENKQIFAEIEYMYVGPEGKPIQPRLRRLGTLEDLIE